MASLADELGYRHRRPNPAQRAVRRFASTRVGARLFSVVAPRVDRALARVGGGRTVAEVAAGLPTVLVTTTGARTGRARTTPLAAIPDGDALALVGTNFGGPRAPAWYANLRAHPDAEVRYRGRGVRVRARAATAAEHARVMATAKRVYAGYAAYERRITGRTIPVLLLERAPAAGPAATPAAPGDRTGG
jgi:deazaflavin-dependent oxidoreductase (nitroreductase family)